MTWSWEPGLRGAENARAILAGIERIRPRLGADTRYHLRHETYNLDAEPEIIEWLAGGRIDAIAFNDHMSGIVESAGRAHKLAPMIERSGLSREDFLAVVERTQRRASEVPASIERLAAAAIAAGPSAAVPRRYQSPAAALVSLARLQTGGISNHGRDCRGSGFARR